MNLDSMHRNVEPNLVVIKVGLFLRPQLEKITRFVCEFVFLSLYKGISNLRMYRFTIGNQCLADYDTKLFATLRGLYANSIS